MGTLGAMDPPAPRASKPAQPHVRFVGVHKAFGDRPVLRDLSCAFPRGRITVVVGGSGSGKSTLLRLIGGLIHPDRGEIWVAGTEISRLGERAMRPVRNSLGMMFQGGALLDSMTVLDNVAFPLREHSDMGRDEIVEAVHACLASVGLTHAADLLPSELSGGMVKRVALARALINKPVIMLCDEPFSGLDPITARRIERLLVARCREQGITLIVVSHDAASTLRMADHLLVLLPDRAVEGSVDEILADPDPRVANLLATDVDDHMLEAGAVEATPRGREQDLESTWC